jgi:hypothetical protein
MLDIPFVTPDGINLFSDENQWFFGSILWSVMAKAQAGMYVTSSVSLQQPPLLQRTSLELTTLDSQ